MTGPRRPTKRVYIGRKQVRRRRRFWTHVINKHYNTILRYAIRLTKDPAKATDLTQQVVSRIFASLPKPSSIYSTQRYLLKSTRNCFLDGKKSVEEVSLDQMLEEGVKHPALAVEPQTQKNLEQNEIVARVIQGMDINYPEIRQLYNLRLLGYTLPQICKLLNIDPRFAQLLWQRFVLKVRKEASKPRRWRSDEDQAA